MDLKKELIDPFVSVSLFVELIAQPKFMPTTTRLGIIE